MARYLLLTLCTLIRKQLSQSVRGNPELALTPCRPNYELVPPSALKRHFLYFPPPSTETTDCESSSGLARLHHTCFSLRTSKRWINYFEHHLCCKTIGLALFKLIHNLFCCSHTNTVSQSTKISGDDSETKWMSTPPPSLIIRLPLRTGILVFS